MLRPNMFVREPFRLFGSIGQTPVAPVREGQVAPGRNLLPNRRMPFNLLPYRFHRRVRSQKAVRKRLVLPQQPEQQVLGLAVRRPKLTGLITRKENHASRLLCIAFEHVPPYSTAAAWARAPMQRRQPLV